MTRRIYTKTGDDGRTGLFGGGRVSKADLRVEAYGTVDELNAVIGWARTLVSADDLATTLESVQSDLFAIGAHLATPPGPRAPALPQLPAERTAELEAQIDGADRELDPLTSFILPGGSAAGAALHLARTVCRRAERRVVALADADGVDTTILIYLNRLSDWLFVQARMANRREGSGDVRWRPGP